MYNDQDIFIREIVSNAVDASEKLIKVISANEYTTMYFNNDSVESVTFNESPERIYQMIEDTIDAKIAKENKK